MSLCTLHKTKGHALLREYNLMDDRASILRVNDGAPAHICSFSSHLHDITVNHRNVSRLESSGGDYTILVIGDD